MAENNRPEAAVPRLGGPKTGGAARFAPHQKPKDGKKTLKRLMLLFTDYKMLVIPSLVLTALSSAVTVAVPFLTGKVFNTFSPASRSVDTKTLSALLASIAFLYIAGWIADTVSGTVILTVSQKLVYALRNAFFDKMQRLPLSFYDSSSRGDTMSRITNDTDTISSTIAQSAAQLVSGLLTLTLSLMVMVKLDLRLTAAVLICVPLTALLTRIIAKKSRNYFTDQQRALGTLDGQIEEAVHSLKMVKAFTKEEETLRSFQNVNEQLCTASTKAQIWAGFMMPFVNVISNLTFTAVAVTGGMLCTSYGLAIGTAVAFLGYAKQFVRPLNSIAGLFSTIQSSLAGAERVFEVLDSAEEKPDMPDAVEPEQIRGDVSFSNVCFSYSGNTQVLHNISFTVRPGQTVALVGETGSGKTTIVNLLNRFYDADSGTITIDSIDITRIKRSSLRSCFSVVLQETSLFSGTVMDNIRYARPAASDTEVQDAAKTAHADEFISRLPQGYNTPISGSSDCLSEGQRQLLAIARAVLCPSPILILDEATSSVDTKTEKDIQTALAELRQGKTCFLIAHRLSTIRDAQMILVINDGKICERGKHEQLMEQRGLYYDMVQSQTGNSPGAAHV